MKLLIIGGTRFLGRHIVEEALIRGHEVTLFNRGKTSPGLFPSATQITADRDGGLSALNGGRWDVVIDTCGYFPRIVRQSAEFLRPLAGRYVFISSISVYDGDGQTELREDSPLATVPDDTPEEITNETYGGLKAHCEEAVRKVWGGDSLMIRPGMIVGPWDPSDRMTYWVSRVAAGGKMAVPQRLKQQIQFIDARDLAAFALDRAEAGDGSQYNAAGPHRPLTFLSFLEGVREAVGSDAEFFKIPYDKLECAPSYAGGVPWILPPDGSWDAFFNANIEQALQAGIKFRPTAETYRDTLAWDLSRQPAERKAGLTPEGEQTLVAEFADEARI